MKILIWINSLLIILLLLILIILLIGTNFPDNWISHILVKIFGNLRTIKST